MTGPKTVFEKTDDGGRFSLQIDGKEAGYVSFVMVSDDTIDIDHTVVRREYEGNGYGRILVDSVIGMADTNGWKIAPNCSYAKHVLEKIGRIR